MTDHPAMPSWKLLVIYFLIFASFPDNGEALKSRRLHLLPFPRPRKTIPGFGWHRRPRFHLPRFHLPGFGGNSPTTPSGDPSVPYHPIPVLTPPPPPQIPIVPPSPVIPPPPPPPPVVPYVPSPVITLPPPVTPVVPPSPVIPPPPPPSPVFPPPTGIPVVPYYPPPATTTTISIP